MFGSSFCIEHNVPASQCYNESWPVFHNAFGDDYGYNVRLQLNETHAGCFFYNLPNNSTEVTEQQYLDAFDDYCQDTWGGCTDQFNELAQCYLDSCAFDKIQDCNNISPVDGDCVTYTLDVQFSTTGSGGTCQLCQCEQWNIWYEDVLRSAGFGK